MIITALLHSLAAMKISTGLHLQLDHIRDPELRPLDELFIDHFTQGLYKHMKGAGETEYEDYEL